MAVLILAKPSVRLNLPILATNSGGRMKEMGRVMFGLNNAEIVTTGPIKRLLPIWLIEFGLFLV